jgi:hypothetical protein
MAKRYSQPQSGSRIDPSKVKDLSLTAVWCGSEPSMVLVSGETATRSITIQLGASQQGKVARFTSVNIEAIRLAVYADSVLGTTQTTIAVLRRCLDTTARASEVFAYNDTGSRCLAHAPYSDGVLYWDFANLTSGSGRISVAYTKDTQWETLVFVAGQTKGREVWRRGVRIANNASAKAVRASTTFDFRLGAETFSAVPSDNIDVALCVVSNGEWTDAQIREWCSNPFQIFQSPPSPIWGAP